MTAWWVEWSELAGELNRRRVADTDGLEAVLDEVELQALLSGRTMQVDIWSPRRRSEAPVLVQILIGDQRRGCLLWHEDGESFAAVDPSVTAPPDDVRYSRVDGAHLVDACCARIEPRTARDALICSLLLGRRQIESVAWEPVPAD